MRIPQALEGPRPKGTWWRAGEVVYLSCPTCGTVGRLAGDDGHQIGADGRVTPSVVCPTKVCDFHAYIQLDGWGEDVLT